MSFEKALDHALAEARVSLLEAYYMHQVLDPTNVCNKSEPVVVTEQPAAQLAHQSLSCSSQRSIPGTDLPVLKDASATPLTPPAVPVEPCSREVSKFCIDRKRPSHESITFSMKSFGKTRSFGRTRHFGQTLTWNDKQPALLEKILFATQGRASKCEGTNSRRCSESWICVPSCAALGNAIVAAAILSNVVVMGVSLDVHPEWRGWTYLDGSFACVFLGEVLFKAYALGCRNFFFGLGSRWNLFELVLVVLAFLDVVAALAETGGDAIDSAVMLLLLRTVRLARIARIMRLARLQIFEDLMLMINGALGGVKTLLWSTLLVAIPVYTIAIILRDTLGSAQGAVAKPFQSLAMSCFTVFRCMVSMDCTTDEGKPIFVLVTQRSGWIFGAFYCVSLMLMAFGLFNVIIAIYVENAVVSARYNDSKQKRCRLLDQSMFVDKAMELVEFIWRVYSGKSVGADVDIDEICKMRMPTEFFEELRSYREFQDILRGLDVSDEDQHDLFDTLDVDGSGTLDIKELIMGISKLRGDARRSDVVAVKLMVRAIHTELKDLGAVLVDTQAVVNRLKRGLRGSEAASPPSAPRLSWRSSDSARLPVQGASRFDAEEWSPTVWQFQSEPL